MGPKKSVEVKLFTRAIFSHSNSSHTHKRASITFHHIFFSFSEYCWGSRYSSGFSIQIRSVTQNMKMGEKSALNFINDVERAFLPFKLISPLYTSSYHFSLYLAHFPSRVAGLLDKAVVFPCKKGPSHKTYENVVARLANIRNINFESLPVPLT